ncbi:hypothetical protein BVRB_8g200340 [Beta vulgaris subsp. vulgaris]|uniref:Uncharacterized protein n=1 Tax=Beta vulgaris subsp. vulgaris TaxID=3555 RepID=A0A7G2RMD4_BETVV|nr:hypothetical protein BVRB_8g200340 [Beta vulgaris subsp. vulgaris]
MVEGPVVWQQFSAAEAAKERQRDGEKRVGGGVRWCVRLTKRREIGRDHEKEGVEWGGREQRVGRALGRRLVVFLLRRWLRSGDSSG